MLRSASISAGRALCRQTAFRNTARASTRCRCHDFSSTSREDHGRRVAAAQALVRERREKQELKMLRHKERADRKKEDSQRKHNQHTLVNAIEHWLSKDPSFLVATMEALNLNAQTSSNKNSTDHPMQPIMDQYRQLYYDSIPTFRDQIMESFARIYDDQVDPEQDDDRKTKFQFQEDLQKLDDAGFGDPKWAKKYRKVRGFRVRETNMLRQIENREKDLDRKQQTIRVARAELANLRQEMELNNRIREARSKVLEAKNTEQRQQQEYLSDASFFSKAFSFVSGFFSPSDDSSLPKQEEKQVQKEVPYRLPARNRLEKRVARKEWDIKYLEREAQEEASKLKPLKNQRNKRPPPMSTEEYGRANKIVEQVRTSICGKLAQHIRQRHEKLIQQFQTLDSKTDLTKPHEWYSYARLDRRKIIFHGGPTNSGKTYSALQRLKEAKNGLYLGPLRLLAAEIYETLTVDGIYTNLFTGQERREIPFSTHSSATVEMASVDDEYDVVVMDEIQMISDVARGAAWTKALLGLRCKEIHVCGGWEAKDIVEKISKACGDEFEVHKYERFSKLEVGQKSLSDDPTKVGAYRHVQPGDCVVAFSRNDIFAIKREIETTTNYKCCVIYGKLPPQTRADQARLFNDPNSEFDILVASDAIGMGLNLNIRRIVFNSIFKFNGENVVRLSHSEIKQISGRAGRRNSPYPNGEVTCRDPRDLPYIHECMSTEIEPIEKAGLLPTAAHIELFSEALGAYQLDEDHTNLHQILRQFSAMATVRGDFFLCRQTEMRNIAKRLKQVSLPLRDAYTMCLSPTTENSMKILENFAWKYSQGQASGLPSRSVPRKAKSFDDLSYLCGLYSDGDLFLWLQLKFPPSNAVEYQAALARKEKTLEFINEALANTESLKLNHCYIRQATRHRTAWDAENVGQSFDDDDDSDSGSDDEYGEEEQPVYY